MGWQICLVPCLSWGRVRDGWVWMNYKKGLFSTKSFYKGLDNSRFPLVPYKGIWILSIPFKICFFFWNYSLDKILTPNHLKSKGWNLPDMCVLCMKEEESVDYLFLHCCMVRKVWGFFLAQLKIFLTFSNQFCDLILGW